MKPKDQWTAFYEHKYTNNSVPSPEGITLIADVHGMRETGKGYVREDGTATDWFGAKWIRDGSIGEIIPDPTVKEFILDEVSNWKEKVVWPDLDAFDWEKAIKIDGIPDINRDEKFIYLFVEEGPFERLHTLMGFQNALMALVTDPESCKEFFAAWIKWKLKLIEKIKEYYNPDVIMFHDDEGTQKDVFYSPETWREMIKPLLKIACDKCHELGMFFEFHSCGKIERIVPDLVDIGADAWQGQEINDVPKLKKITNNKLAYHTMPDYQSLVLQTDNITEEEVRRVTRENFIRHLQGGQYSPLIMPFGDWVTETMTDEIFKLCDEYKGDPE